MGNITQRQIQKNELIQLINPENGELTIAVFLGYLEIYDTHDNAHTCEILDTETGETYFVSSRRVIALTQIENDEQE